MPCDKIDCHLKIECFDAYGKFNYPPCASESVEPKADSLQQLKAEIAALIPLVKACSGYARNGEAVRNVVEKMRQLSAV